MPEKSKQHRLLRLILMTAIVIEGIFLIWILVARSDSGSVGNFGDPTDINLNDIIGFSTSQPAEVPVEKDTYVWKGSAEDPKYITLPSIASEGFIEQVGINQERQIAVPTNIHIAGWYINSLRPGEEGLSIIDGHVGVGNPGIFSELWKLVSGDIFSIEFGDGTVRQFRVEEVLVVDAETANTALFTRDPEIKSQLNLITCDGDFDRLTRQYDQRVIVVSSAIE